MKRIALVYQGNVVNVALWDGASPWDPVVPGECDTAVDVTSQPLVDLTYTYSGPTGWMATGGSFTPPA